MHLLYQNKQAKTITARDCDTHKRSSWKDQEEQAVLLSSVSLGFLGARKVGAWFRAVLKKWVLGPGSWHFQRSCKSDCLSSVYHCCQKDVAFGERWNLHLWHRHIANNREDSCAVRLKEKQNLSSLLSCSSLKPQREWVYFYFSIFPLRHLLAFFLLPFHCNLNANICNICSINIINDYKWCSILIIKFMCFW